MRRCINYIHIYIDWIRIYQKGDVKETFSCPSASDAIEPEGGWQGIEAVVGDGLPVMGEKELRNGQILIRRGEKIYDIMGREMRLNTNGNR